MEPPYVGCYGSGVQGAKNGCRSFLLAVAALVPSLTAVAQTASHSEATSPLREQASSALRRGVEFFRKEVAVEGTYLWQYSEDLSKREGEGKASATRGWVQPPGTPAVGMAYLTAFEATGDTGYLDAARDTAYGLVRGQLQSGGWTYSIDFNAISLTTTATCPRTMLSKCRMARRPSPANTSGLRR
jgi:hypothetical protein